MFSKRDWLSGERNQRTCCVISILQSSAYLSKSDRAGPAGGDRRLRGNFFSGFGFSTHLAHTHSLPAFRLGAIVSFSSHPYIPAENDGSERAGKERQRGGGARRVQWGPAPRHRRFCHLRPSPSLHQQRGSRTHLSLSRALITRLLLARYM
jgi:hypothetical protein